MKSLVVIQNKAANVNTRVSIFILKGIFEEHGSEFVPIMSSESYFLNSWGGGEHRMETIPYFIVYVVTVQYHRCIICYYKKEKYGGIQDKENIFC